MRNMRNKGFTLVEILIVVVILGILAAIVIPQFTDASTEAKQSSLDSNIHAMQSAIQLFEIREGAWPTALTDLTSGSYKYLRSIPDNPFTDGHAEGTDWLYDNTTGEVSAPSGS